MTNEQIDAIPAGPEMDRAVAEVVGMNHPIAGSPHCSTLDGVALAAMERWVSADWQRCYEIKRLEREGPDDDPLYSAFVSFNGGRLWYQSFDDMIAAAICRALLKAEAGRKGKEDRDG